MSEQHTPEPFGYFKPEPFGWTDCAESDDDAIPLYDKVAIKLIEKRRDKLSAEVEELKLIIATDTGTESAVANLQQQVSHLVDMVACEKSNAEYFKRQRDELLAILVEFSEALPSDKYMEKQGQTPGPLLQRIRSAIASVKANTQ